MAKSMPWLPANMTPERQRRVEAFSRLRRVSRAEAAAILIDAGVEALRPVVASELEERHTTIRKALLGERAASTEKPYVERFQRALESPATWCISGRCEDTNWGGRDRLHYRGEGCPPFNRAEIEGYIWRCTR